MAALPPCCKGHKDSWAPGDALNTGMTSRQDKDLPVSQPCLNSCLKWKERALINITAVSRQQRIPFKTQPAATRVVKYSTPCHVQPDFNATQSPAPKKAHSRDEAPSLCSKRWLFSTWLLTKEGTSDLVTKIHHKTPKRTRKLQRGVTQLTFVTCSINPQQTAWITLLKGGILNICYYKHSSLFESQRRSLDSPWQLCPSEELKQHLPISHTL